MAIENGRKSVLFFLDAMDLLGRWAEHLGGDGDGDRIYSSSISIIVSFFVIYNMFISPPLPFFPLHLIITTLSFNTAIIANAVINTAIVIMIIPVSVITF